MLYQADIIIFYKDESSTRQNLEIQVAPGESVLDNIHKMISYGEGREEVTGLSIQVHQAKIQVYIGAQVKVISINFGDEVYSGKLIGRTGKVLSADKVSNGASPSDPLWHVMLGDCPCFLWSEELEVIK